MALIQGTVKAIFFNQTDRRVSLFLENGDRHLLAVSPTLSAELQDIIGLTSAGDNVMVYAAPGADSTSIPFVKEWENRTLATWLSDIKRQEAAKLVVQMEPIIALIQARLVDLGWTAVKSSAIAMKYYDTAVGPKQALVYISDFGPQEGSVRVTGEYWSEGRDCLSTTSVLISRQALPSDIDVLVQQFAVEADAVVGQTYAARLHRPIETA